MKAAETQTEIQIEPRSGSHCEEETEVSSNSIRDKKFYYCTKFFWFLFYEMYWSRLLLLVFYVFQPQCKWYYTAFIYKDKLNFFVITDANFKVFQVLICTLSLKIK